MIKTINQIVLSDLDKPIVPNNYENITEVFQGYRHIVWDKTKLEKFILKNGDNKVLEAINSLKPYSFKADIAKYYLVYKLGGWYSDVNNFFVEKIEESDFTMVIFKDDFKHTKTTWAVASGLFYAPNINNKVLKIAVDQCVSNVTSRYYGGHALCPTGPNLFGSAIARNNLLDQDNYLIGDFKGSTSLNPGYYIGDTIVCKYKSNGLKPANSGIAGGNNYADLWHSRSVYNDN